MSVHGSGRPFERPDHRHDWERHGLVGPIRIMSRQDATGIGRDFMEQHARSGDASRRNRHVDLPVLAALCGGGIWWPVHEILGDRLLLWRTNMFLGNPALPWHEDRHAGLFVGEAFSLSVMVAIGDSPPDNCTVFVPGSHRLAVREKERRFGIEARPQAFGNVRYEGRITSESCRFLALEAGEMIVFHPALLHASSGHVHGPIEPSAERMSITFSRHDAPTRSRVTKRSPGSETETPCCAPSIGSSSRAG